MLLGKGRRYIVHAAMWTHVSTVEKVDYTVKTNVLTDGTNVSTIRTHVPEADTPDFSVGTNISTVGAHVSIGVPHS